MSAADTLAGRVAALRERIERAALRGGRRPESVTLVAASKTQPAEAVRAALAAGVTIFGENRVQEADAKIPLVGGGTWHMIGRLQRNKARRAVELFAVVHSLDSLRLGEALDRAGRERGHPVPVLVEVNLGGEESKGGFAPDALDAALEVLAGATGLEVRGFMTVPPPADDPAASRPHFRTLARLLEAARAAGRVPATAVELSMGMSDDFEVGIEEGATMVRIGTALFGPRAYPAGFSG